MPFLKISINAMLENSMRAKIVITALSCAWIFQGAWCMLKGSGCEFSGTPLLEGILEIQERTHDPENLSPSSDALSPTFGLSGNLRKTDSDTVPNYAERNELRRLSSKLMPHVKNFKETDVVFIKNEFKIEEIAERLQYYYKQVEMIVEEKARKTATPSHHKPRKLKSLSPLGCFGSKIEKDKNLTVSLDQILSGLSDCLHAIHWKNLSEALYPLRWDMWFQVAIFQLVEFMHKFEVITADEMRGFFATDETRMLTGYHIAKLFPYGLETGLETYTGFRPDIEYLTMTWQTKHLHECLAGLDDIGKNFIIHCAFSISFSPKLSAFNNDLERCTPALLGMATYFTRDSVYAYLSRWGHEEPIEPEFLKNLNCLIGNFLGRDNPIQHSLLKTDLDYHLSFVLLGYILNVNKSKSNLLLENLDGEGEAKLFNSRFALIYICRELASWMEQLAPKSSNKDVAPGIEDITENQRYHIVKTIKRKLKAYNRLQDEYMKTPHKYHHLIDPIINGYIQKIDLASERIQI